MIVHTCPILSMVPNNIGRHAFCERNFDESYIQKANLQTQHYSDTPGFQMAVLHRQSQPAPPQHRLQHDVASWIDAYLWQP